MGSGSRRGLLLAGGAGLALAAIVAVIVVLVSGSGGRHTAAPAARATPTTRTATGALSTPPAHTTSTSAPAAAPPPGGQQRGASVNILFNSGAFSQAQIDAQLRALAATGATIARSDALWEMVEPAPPSGGIHRYDWAFDDRIAGSLAAHGLRWLPIVDYSAPWAGAGGGAHPAPSSAADYAAFAAALAARYGPGGAFWRSHPEIPAAAVGTYEIWNEPDNATFWSPAPDAAGYAALYARARAAIDAIDPSARVIIGGLTHPEAFLPSVLAAAPQLRGQIDGVAIHPYAPSPAAVLDRVGEARAVLDRLGLGGVPLYVTELGWTTRPPHALNWAPSSQRGRDLGQTLADLGHTDCDVAAVVLYTWVTLERNPADREDWYGISPPGGGESADVAAFTAGLRDASAPGPDLRTCAGLR
jgi:hypothetical protein